jgi:hypothetical protein
VPADRRVTITLPPDVPVGPAEIQLRLEPPPPGADAVGDGPTNDPKFNREWAAFHELVPELLETHRGQCVAIHEGRVVGSGTDKVAVAMDAHQRFGNISILVREVAETPDVVRIISPSRRRPQRLEIG